MDRPVVLNFPSLATGPGNGVNGCPEAFRLLQKNLRFPPYPNSMTLNSLFRGKTFVLVVIAALFLGLAFFDFSGGGGGGAAGPTCRIKIYGKCYRDQEVRRLSQFYVVANQLFFAQFAQSLFGADRRDGDPTDFVTNLIVLRKEAERLGIEPTMEEAKEAIRNAPIFSIRPGMTDEQLEANLLTPLGLTKADLIQVGKDYLAWRKISDLLEAGNAPVDVEINKAYVRDNQQFTGSLAEFLREDFVEKVEITDEKIKTYYEENKGRELPDGTRELYSDEKRGVFQVTFLPPAETEEMTAEQKAEQKLKFNNRVNEIYANTAESEERFIEKMKQTANDPENGFEIKTKVLAPFSLESPPETLKDQTEILTDLFSAARSTEPGRSVTVPFPQEDGSFLLFQVTEIVEPKELTLEESREQIRKAITARESNLLVNEAATAARGKMLEALEAGKKPAEAAKAAGIELKPLEPFSRKNPPANLDAANQIVMAALQTEPGSVSEVLPMTLGKGYHFLFVEKSELVESEEEESLKSNLRISATSQYRTTMFQAWLREKLSDAGISRDGPVLPEGGI